MRPIIIQTVNLCVLVEVTLSDKTVNIARLKLGYGPRLGSSSGNTLIVNDCTVLSTLGSGSFGEVLLCRRDSGELVALKALSKSRLERKREVKNVEGLDGDKKQVVVVTALDRVYSEIQIMRSIGKHPNIISLLEVFTDASSDDLYLCLDYANAGQLMTFDKDVNCFRSHVSNGPFPLSIARQCFSDLIRGLSYLHSKGIAHRDIKPENLLLDSSGILRVCDFSVAKQFSKEDTHPTEASVSDSLGWVTDTAGSFLFLCPEACSGTGYSAFKADVWAAGCVLYLMIFGVPPFGSTSYSTMELFDAVQSDPLTFPFNLSCDPIASKESLELVDILSGILGKKKEEERLTLEQICNHDFLSSLLMDNDSIDKDSSSNRLTRYKFEETDVTLMKPYSSPTLAVMHNIRNSLGSENESISLQLDVEIGSGLSPPSLPPPQNNLYKSKEGFLTKRGHIIPSNKRRFFSLQGEKLLYGKVYERVQRGEIILRGATLNIPSSTLAFSITERGPLKKRFFSGEKMTSFSTGKVYHLQAETESERALWLECIEVNIKRATELEKQESEKILK